MWSNISTSSSPARASEHEALREQQDVCDQLSQNDHDEQSSRCKRRYGSPLVRYKHAVCAAQASGYIYIHGGRFGNLPLDDDVWRFDPHQNSWIQLQTSGCKPPSLQEHTLVEYCDRLYLFGGQISAPSSENSFWCLDLANNQWRSLSMKSSSRYGAYLGPTNRRGHTAVLYGNSMYVYGGFEDFRGSSGQLWEYDLLNDRWELRNLSAASSCHPEPRHSHSAIVHNDSMYIYGGLSNLKPLGDLWRWSWRERRWFRERTRGSAPGQLHGHTAIQAFGSMFVFGGERNGRTTRGLWRLNLSNMTWQKIRPKGPRPNPTTWHGAIANPLCILDEANYIIEGDPSLVLKDVSADNCCRMSISAGYDDGDDLSSKQQRACEPVREQRTPAACALAHSRSSNVVVESSCASVGGSSNGWNIGGPRSKHRKSRLSFLRKSRHHADQRPKSIHEQRQIRQSLSANNFYKREPRQVGLSNRHSVALIKREPSSACDHHHERASQVVPMDCEPAATNNVGILDSLDTDIKEMFQRALSPKLPGGSQQVAKTPDDEAPMSVDASSRSFYVTAPIERTENSNTISSSMNQLRSQRTSFACTTPPSETNARREDSSASFSVYAEIDPNRRDDGQSASLLASKPSGYDRRDNRPRSEIVQSLIDRADARIKHLYTPYFNQQQPSTATNDNKLFVRRRADTSRGAAGHEHQSRRGQSFLDKSKRHTIHQTMTYYNLYYSEEKSSSGDSGSQQDSSNSPKDEAQAGAANMSKLRDMEDFGSSSTMKGASDEITAPDGLMNTSSAVLVGIHQNQRAQVSELLTMHDVNSSESQTLCQDSSTSQTTAQPTSCSNGQLIGSESSFQNALTARRDTTSQAAEESQADNTSLSFSVIAEFEEDDMLQYQPSPTITETTRRQQPSNTASGATRLTQYPSKSDDNIDHQDDDENSDDARSYLQRPNRVETILMREPEDQLQTMIVVTDPAAAARQQQPQPQPRRIVQPDGENALSVHNKSTSSGYDSIASRNGHDTPPSQVPTLDSTSKFDTSRFNSAESHNSCGPSGSSMRTSESALSSLIGRVSSSSTTIDTTTSPEQSAMKKLRARCGGGGDTEQRNGKSSVLSAGDDESAADGQQLSATASSSPKTMEERERRGTTIKMGAKQTQHKTASSSIMSRSRFFGGSSSKSRYWQLCMFVIGGKQGQGTQGINEPITVWRLYI